MSKSLNELVLRLTENQEVECPRPEKTASALKESIDRDYVHVMFKKTGTELGIQLDKKKCVFKDGDFEKGQGKIHLEGGLILNYDKVRCISEIQLDTCEGTGYLVPLTDQEYAEMMENKTE